MTNQHESSGIRALAFRRRLPAAPYGHSSPGQVEAAVSPVEEAVLPQAAGGAGLGGLLTETWHSKVMLIFTFVTTKYSRPSQVVPLVMPFPKLSLEPL